MRTLERTRLSHQQKYSRLETDSDFIGSDNMTMNFPEDEGNPEGSGSGQIQELDMESMND